MIHVNVVEKILSQEKTHSQFEEYISIKITSNPCQPAQN